MTLLLSHKEHAADDDETALVVFADSSLRCLKVLRRGFRHCFVAVLQATGWIIVDPLSHQTDLRSVQGVSLLEMAAWYRCHGLCVVETRVRPAPLRLAPLGLYTCVEVVKRVLGIHARWVVTPWQLYRFLIGPTSVRYTSPMSDRLDSTLA